MSALTLLSLLSIASAAPVKKEGYRSCPGDSYFAFAIPAAKKDSLLVRVFYVDRSGKVSRPVDKTAPLKRNGRPRS